MIYSLDDPIGADFTLDNEGDLALDSYGRLVYTRAEETLRQALIRRISTALYAYQRYVRVGSQSYILNRTYGNTIVEFVGQPIDNIEELIRLIEDVVRQEKRVNFIDLAFTPIDPTDYLKGIAKLEVIYAVNPSYSTKTLDPERSVEIAFRSEVF